MIQDRIPRNEYPRPQFQRKDWLCLNGEWGFEFDQGDSGIERGLLERPLRDKIVVPFCPESELSGIGNHDLHNVVWYRRVVSIPESWDGRKVYLHFQAIDYDATVWVNGVEVGRHRGAWCGFSCDLRGLASPGEKAVIVVRARDLMSNPMPRGKQSAAYTPQAAEYFRTTGIWQSVWMEPVPETHLQRTWLTPDVANSTIRVRQPIQGPKQGMTVRATLMEGHESICTRVVPADQDFEVLLDLVVPKDKVRLWSPQDPHLYSIRIELLDRLDQTVDDVATYAALRSVTISGKALLLNGKPVFQRLVLDQGYYPDGLMTAPTDEAMVCDIKIAQEAGFNGARLHQKVFEERFLYHADRMGYLCWAEFGDWGIDRKNPPATYITQWLEVLRRDYSHPSIVGWCALNETWYETIEDNISGLDDLTRGMFWAARYLDSTRPVIDASGGAHRVAETDIYDSHDYEQDPVKFEANQSGLSDGKPYVNVPEKGAWSTPYRGQPYFVSEFGGTWWSPDESDRASWGYGDRPKDIEAFYDRFEKLCGVLLNNPEMFGYCFTQLTDVFQEQNGLYGFDRTPKFDIERLRKVQDQAAAIESGMKTSPQYQR